MHTKGTTEVEHDNFACSSWFCSSFKHLPAAFHVFPNKMVAICERRFASSVRLVEAPIAFVDAAIGAPPLPRAVPIALVPFG